MAYDPSLGKTSEDFRFIFTYREAIGTNKQKIRSHLGPVAQVSGRLCEAKPVCRTLFNFKHFTLGTLIYYCSFINYTQVFYFICLFATKSCNVRNNDQELTNI